MNSPNSQVYYWAGIGVVAFKYAIRVVRIAIDDADESRGEAVLEPIGRWRNPDVGMDYYKTMLVENYATALLAGSAASFIRTQDQRCDLKRSLGDAGLEERYLREVGQCRQRESDRAIAIIFGSLGAYDDGNVEATTRRLWHRAVRVLRQKEQYEQLKLLAKRLLEVKRMSWEELCPFLIGS
jgi:hypothetical protein